MTDLHRSNLINLLAELKAITNSKKTYDMCTELTAFLAEPPAPLGLAELCKAAVESAARGKP